jgi:glyoxylase-like metal-dependent hydrolase (beta-lactamase superfamily II)
MTIHIKAYTLGIVSTNTYLIGDTETNNAILIDPVDDAPVLFEAAQEEDWTIKLILATHAHFDHVLASQPLKAMTNAPFALHADAAAELDGMPQRGLLYFGQRFPEAAKPDRLLTTESETIQVSGITLETLYTPGHAPGHISFFMPAERLVFSGDALFKGSIGRTDLPGGDHQQLINSITDKLLTLGDDVRVLPGHGDVTTIGKERQNNPYLQF